jgi:hypothetical protein
MIDKGRDGNGPAGVYVGRHLAELGEGVAVDLLDVDVEDGAAGEADGEGVVYETPYR